MAALVLDAWLGEPRRFHPLVGFGVLATRLERLMNHGAAKGLRGLTALSVLVLPPVLLVVVLLAALPGWLSWCCQTVGLWLVLGGHSLAEHGRAVSGPLSDGDLNEARRQVARMVSRDTDALDESGVAKAATESVLENGADALFASLFWFALAGLPGALLHRLVNTLDAMWGYRTDRFASFGKAAARLDDGLNGVPARLTALGYALCGRFVPALDCWRRQAGHCESPNAGPVMAAGAGALGVRLGGGAPYHGCWRDRPELGLGRPASAASIDAAIALVQRALCLWVLVLLGLAL